MSLDLEAITERAEAAANRSYCGDCGLRLANEVDFNSTTDGEGTHLCWSEYSECSTAYGITAGWREKYGTDVPALVAEVERLRWMETELTQAVRLADQEADGIQAELVEENKALRAVLAEMLDRDRWVAQHPGRPTMKMLNGVDVAQWLRWREALER